MCLNVTDRFHHKHGRILRICIKLYYVSLMYILNILSSIRDISNSCVTIFKFPYNISRQRLHGHHAASQRGEQQRPVIQSPRYFCYRLQNKNDSVFTNIGSHSFHLAQCTLIFNEQLDNTFRSLSSVPKAQASKAINKRNTNFIFDLALFTFVQ